MALITEEPITALADYARIPIAFEVSRIFDVETRLLNHRLVLLERPLPAPYIKDYDAIKGETPAQWPQHFDLSHWTLFSARIEGRHVGGAAIAFKTPGLKMLEGREDLAVLWDIRVSPDSRGRGIGAALFQAAEAWAAAKGCKQLKLETQNTNLPACRFYQSQGCTLGAAHPFAYPDLPDEIQLLWYKDLTPPHARPM